MSLLEFSRQVKDVKVSDALVLELVMVNQNLRSGLG